MNKQLLIESTIRQRKACSTNTLIANYRDYINHKMLTCGEKLVFSYKGLKLSFTPKQVEVMRLVAKGFSNGKIARMLSKNESAIKLLIHRITNYLEEILHENIDRFYLIIIAQRLNLEKEYYMDYDF